MVKTLASASLGGPNPPPPKEELEENMNVEELVKELVTEYDLTYRCGVNLEGTINNLLHFGLTIEQARNVLTDVLDNFEFLDVMED